MAEIRAFRGLHYNLAKVKNLADVITPHYDVISQEQRMQYLKQNPWNVVRLILPEGEDPYGSAARLLQEWKEHEVLVMDAEPGIYCYHQAFRTPDGMEKTRKGFLALVRLEDFEKGVILPHEQTLSAPKEDRLNLLRACKTNFSPIFGIYSDPAERIDRLLEPLTQAPPRCKVIDHSQVINTVWNIQDSAVVGQIQDLMKENWVLIADGHHRYESCLLYRNEMTRENPDPAAPFQFTLMFFTNIHHPGITVLPYNRGVFNLPGFNPEVILSRSRRYFEVHEFESRDQAISAMQREGNQAMALVALLRDRKGVYLFKLKSGVPLKDFYPPPTPEIVQKLDVNILHKIFIQELLSVSEEDVRGQKFLRYYKDTKEEWNDFESGKLQIAFFLNPTKVDQVVEVSRAGLKMPQKSTFFYPKLMTGFVMNQH